MMGDYKGYKQKEAPVQVDDEYEVTIEATGAKGDGIAKIGGFAVFVPEAQEGDQLRIKITRVMQKFAFAEIVQK
ncbi:MAG: TRAM domain-containing protein [bacterium]|nr:TRAM domain-containing protein [bacterium]